jgi:predicted short-subunit dehydrogenase-like oxidoreductase (DUF2520 family)
VEDVDVGDVDVGDPDSAASDDAADALDAFDVSRCAVVGAGRVGTALVRSLSGCAGPFGRGFDGAHFGIVVLAVPDREIAAAARCVVPTAGRVVGHCSGATGLDVLSPHEAFGLHPLMTVGGVPSVSEVSGSASPFAGAPAAVAGSSARAMGIARALAGRLGMVPFPIDDRDRAAYHAAASIASNFLVTLEDAAETLATTAGVQRAMLLPLIRATIDNWAATGRTALTGPVARGDALTVTRQRAAITERAPELLALFDALVDRTRAIADR